MYEDACAQRKDDAEDKVRRPQKKPNLDLELLAFRTVI